MRLEQMPREWARLWGKNIPVGETTVQGLEVRVCSWGWCVHGTPWSPKWQECEEQEGESSGWNWRGNLSFILSEMGVTEGSEQRGGELWPEFQRLTLATVRMDGVGKNRWRDLWRLLQSSVCEVMGLDQAGGPRSREEVGFLTYSEGELTGGPVIECWLKLSGRMTGLRIVRTITRE